MKNIARNFLNRKIAGSVLGLPLGEIKDMRDQVGNTYSYEKDPYFATVDSRIKNKQIGLAFRGYLSDTGPILWVRYERSDLDSDRISSGYERFEGAPSELTIMQLGKISASVSRVVRVVNNFYD
jgi:hypothetical protein